MDGGDEKTSAGDDARRYLSLTKVDEVLQIDVLPVVDDGVVDHPRHSVPRLGKVRRKQKMTSEDAG